ncbi:MAG TPA: hypothetical protein VNV43_00110 [Candidatus Acidoferrales bacterium]|nr:hypothetical protein [Candidatus Acidoferrales bacterium]
MSDTKNIAPLKLILEGQFWDSHIYRGKLYLFTLDGCLHTVDWDRLVSEFIVPDDLALPMQCAFSRNDSLYETQRDPVQQDPQVREIIQNKFVQLGKHHQTPRLADWRRYLISTQDSPYPFPHIDATLYSNGFFFVSENGVHVISTKQLEAKGKKKWKAAKLWDCPVISLDASYGGLAMAAGPEGLFEFELTDWVHGDTRQAKQIDKGVCTDCSWAYYSIVGSSHKQGGVFAEFVKDESQDGRMTRQDFEPTNLGRSWRDAPKMQHRFEKVIGPRELFNQDGYCWGGKDKICQAGDGEMTIARYTPWLNGTDRFRVLRRVTYDPGKGNPVAAAVAPFGSIIELDKSIVIVRSDDEILNIPGVSVNWRVFNRSKQYENQLHVIYERRLEVYSFNHDYFVDQKEKFSGIRAYGSLNGEFNTARK